jgi:peptidoglycan/xylan/chitin deacetylase (PgdA/CDA1 family)
VEITRQKFLVAATSALLIPQVEIAEAKSTTISMLPHSKTRRFAWTIDDGVSSSAVGKYLDIAEQGDNHLTLFVTSCYSSWRNHSKQISRLLKAGKIQLGNHTVTHKDLTTVSEAVIKKELYGCHKFLLEEFGYDARPYFRPPYGSTNPAVRSVAAELGYTVQTTWYGSFGDAQSFDEQRILQFANKWIANGRIVIDHSNRMKSQHLLNQIQEIVKARGLHSVTLTEAFGKNFK